MLGAGIILLNKKNQVLLLLRDNKADIPFPNMWDIPGGRVEHNESPEFTVRREMFEELGIVDLGDIDLFKIYSSEDLVDYIFWKRIDLNPAAIELKEGQRIEYFDLSRIRSTKLAFEYNIVLEEFYLMLAENE
ncbi:MAG: NUDIX domain-containing protein [Ignavibacteriota bacterium]|jgi:8-oxo-dGTP diphosphatase|nr:MAG: NUDIX domain-containing protein [Ignavibacterium sp.]MBL1154205.1 NUDIX domain-containing protein [Ignavibacteriota bacterium]MCO6448767.1 NUDIX domain-containing protein [Ignavibacterium album]MCZ2269606.1 NUDIX domain-containing protein [Ignavibacteriales bacterium]MDX9713762.1 NUDIX domain-containing protein [Ignavibacteriaceae bacterium]